MSSDALSINQYIQLIKMLFPYQYKIYEICIKIVVTLAWDYYEIDEFMNKLSTGHLPESPTFKE